MYPIYARSESSRKTANSPFSVKIRAFNNYWTSWSLMESQKENEKHWKYWHLHLFCEKLVHVGLSVVICTILSCLNINMVLFFWFFFFVLCTLFFQGLFSSNDVFLIFFFLVISRKIVVVVIVVWLQAIYVP